MKPTIDGPRACRPSELDEVMGLINEVFRAGISQDIRTDYPLVFDPAMMKYQRVLRVDDQVVAHVPVAPREVVAVDDRFTIGIICPTVTHPDYRRQGYASLCLRDCIRIMEEEDWPVSVLWTQVRTFPFYQASGYEAVASQGWVYRTGAEDADLFHAWPFDVVRYDTAEPRHLEAISEMHDAEPYRISRSLEAYRALFALPKISTFLALNRKGEVSAYLTHGESTNKPGLIEAGGEIEGVETLVRHVLQKVEAGREVQVIVPLIPSILGDLLEERKPGSRRPVEEAAGIGNQVHRINGLEQFLRGIQGHLRGSSKGLRGEVCLSCSDSGEAVTIGFNHGDVSISAKETPEKVTLSRRQLTQLIFGAHPTGKPVEIDGTAGEILRGLFPYYFPVCELDHC